MILQIQLILQKFPRYFRGYGSLKIPNFPKITKLFRQIQIFIFAKKTFQLRFLIELSVMNSECRAFMIDGRLFSGVQYTLTQGWATFLACEPFFLIFVRQKKGFTLV